ncbi:dCTP deaminase domain-containing protein [uncultured Oscillibacter sp.]|jgi:deoxycytidine triphosphate deaminase|uniref:dCTP deaminase domain-containing protein n=1 Tax=uncultured Oscillibacter sp. TaxID=876091 RepID=UPI0026700397|nr:hypothetical protein [uncultured Oscillibacter sp.]
MREREIKCKNPVYKMLTPKGQLSKHDILQEIEKKDGLKIFPCYPSCLKAASYDITPTLVAMSAKLGMLETVYCEACYCGPRYYFYVHPKDTVLVVSNEFISVPGNIAGDVASRVSMVVKGFGHISTTIDPFWHGAALIGLSNPTNQVLKVYLNEPNKPNQLATVSFYYLNSPCSPVDVDSGHVGMRLDLLKKVNYQQRTGLRNFLRQIIHWRRKAFTDYFFFACETKYKNLNLQNWNEFLDEFSRLKYPEKNKNEKKYTKKSQKVAADFIITENIIIRIYHFLSKHKVLSTLLIVALVIMLERLGLIPVSVKEFLLEVLTAFFE